MRNQRLKCVFIGHGRFGAQGLETLLSEHRDHVQVLSVFQDLTSFVAPLWDDPHAVSRVARKFPIPVFEGDLNDSGYLAHLHSEAPDFGLIMRCPRKLPASLLKLPRLGFLNMHASDLPKYQGIAPLEYAMVNEDEICLTVHQVSEQFDCGDILLKSKMASIRGKYLEEVFSLMVDLGRQTVGEVVRALQVDSPKFQPQDLSKACPATRKGLAQLLALDFNRDPGELLHRKMLARGRMGTKLWDIPVQVLGFEKTDSFAGSKGELLFFDGHAGLVVNEGVLMLEFQHSLNIEQFYGRSITDKVFESTGALQDNSNSSNRPEVPWS